jgi:hypothetical protein
MRTIRPPDSSNITSSQWLSGERDGIFGHGHGHGHGHGKGVRAIWGKWKKIFMR